MADEWNRYSHLFEDGSQVVASSEKRQRAPGLIDEAPIPVYPTLAALIGINEAVTLQQIHFLLNSQRTSKNHYNYIEGRWWVYNSYAQWHTEHFPWLSESSIKRILRWHEANGYLLSMQSVKNKSDRRKWYSIDYAKWNDFLQMTIGLKWSHQPSDQNSLMGGLKKSDGYSESTSESTNTLSSGEDAASPKTPRKPRKRNEAADAVTIHFFQTELGTNPETERQAAITAAWMTGGNAPKNLNIQKLNQGLTIDEIIGVARYFKHKHPDADMPRSLTKIARWTWDYIAAGKPATNTNGKSPLSGFKEYTGKESA